MRAFHLFFLNGEGVTSVSAFPLKKRCFEGGQCFLLPRKKLL